MDRNFPQEEIMRDAGIRGTAKHVSALSEAAPLDSPRPKGRQADIDFKTRARHRRILGHRLRAREDRGEGRLRSRDRGRHTARRGATDARRVRRRRAAGRLRSLHEAGRPTAFSTRSANAQDARLRRHAISATTSRQPRIRSRRCGRAARSRCSSVRTKPVRAPRPSRSRHSCQPCRSRSR